MRRWTAAVLLLGYGVAVAQVPHAPQVEVLTQHNNNARTGANLAETTLTPANVSPAHFGLLFKHAVDDQLYTQPLVATGVKLADGTHDVVYVTTVNNSVYAFDANDGAAAEPLWHVNFGTPANVHSAPFGCTDMNGNMGIVGTPVIDRARNTLYVVALSEAGGTFTQRLHALDLATGADLPASPARIEAKDFDPLMQNQRPALLLSHGQVYVSYASHCDKDPYHGFVMAYDATTLKQTAVFNTTPTGSEASIWQSGQGPAADAAGNIYVVSGNGSWDGKQNFSESFLKLTPDLKLTDWFTPTNHFLLDKQDNDLNSSGATLVPSPKGTIIVGGGKEGVLYTIDPAHFGHLGDEHALGHFKATASHLHSLVYWQSAAHGPMIYIWGQRDIARVYAVKDGHVEEKPLMTRTLPNEGHPGAMLSLSANGDKDGILWAAIHASGDSWHESRPGILHAYAADDITHELWNSLEVPARDDCGNYSKMAPPTILNGKVYLPSFGTANTGSGQLCVYGLLPGATAAAAPGTPANLKEEERDARVSLSWTPVAGATSYRVLGSKAESPGAGATQVLAAGLITPAYSEPAPGGGHGTYTVVAVNSAGASLPATAVAVTYPPIPSTHGHGAPAMAGMQP
jgi:outer membrane protein assembly factor BamB